MKRVSIALGMMMAVAAAGAQRVPEGSNIPPVPDYIPASGTIHTTILIAGSKAGDAFSWTTADGKVHLFVQFNDRGRGPKIDGTFTLNDKGWPTAYTASGLGYYKTPESEEFTFDGTTSVWKNKDQHGSAPGLGGFYSGGSFLETNAMRVHAARLNGGTLPLLPSGDMRVKKARTEMVTVAGTRVEVTAYAVTYSTSALPSYVWVDADDHFFAAPGSWGAYVRAGAEAEMPRLLAIENELRNADVADEAHRLTQVPGHDVLIHDVALFDSVAAAIVPHQSVVVSGNKIVRVGPAASIKAAADAKVIEGRGLTLLPGLWDMHEHITVSELGLANLAVGVTTARDLANDVDDLMARRARIEAGDELGTRIIAAGFVDGRGPFQGPTKALVDTPEEVRTWVEKYHQLGYPQMKIYSSIKPELVPLIVEEAHKRGMRVSGHIPAGMIAADAVRAGFDELQHMNFIFLNFMPDVKETRTLARFLEPAKRSADIDPTSPQVQAFIAQLVEHHVAVDPTLVAFERQFLARDGQVSPSVAAVVDRFPPAMQRSMLGGGFAQDEATYQQYRRSFENWKRMTKELYDHGVTLDVGTDAYPAGFVYQRELELLTQAGIPAAKVLQIATLTSARTMKRDAELGSIASGKLADLVLVEGDPTTDIAAIRRVRTTIKDGKLYDAAALFHEMGIKPAP